MRLIFFVLLFWTVDVAVAQSLTGHQPDNPAVTRLTWDDINLDRPPYPFEDRLEACIQAKRELRQTGRTCLGIAHEYLPTTPHPKPAPGKSVPSSYSDRFNYLVRYWDDRLNHAYKRLMEHYHVYDDQYHKRLAPAYKLRDVQRRWNSWRDIKCEFEEHKAHLMSKRMRVLDQLDCRYIMTAERALELEAILVYNDWEITDTDESAP